MTSFTKNLTQLFNPTGTGLTCSMELGIKSTTRIINMDGAQTWSFFRKAGCKHGVH